MDKKLAPLFEPLGIKDRIFKNRIIMPPMVVNRGITTPAGIEWYGDHAAGGPAMVIVEATEVSRFGTDFTVETMDPLVDAIHKGGALAGIQLFPLKIGTKVFPADLEPDQIEQIIENFRNAAEICRNAGFDAIEPHGAHNYLINLFFSPVKNKREDNYGGSLANRMRFGLEIVRTIRPACQHMLLMYRHTPIGAGYTMEESIEFGRALVEAGVDILDISPASADAPGDRSAPFKDLGVPVIAVNNLNQTDRALEVLDKNRGDLCAVGRQLITDAEWPNKVKDGRLEEILLCTDCNKTCWGTLRKGVPVVCRQNQEEV